MIGNLRADIGRAWRIWSGGCSVAGSESCGGYLRFWQCRVCSLAFFLYALRRIRQALLHPYTESHVGSRVRIVGGSGAGQSPLRCISNTAATLTLESQWDVAPDLTSVLVHFSDESHADDAELLRSMGIEP